MSGLCQTQNAHQLSFGDVRTAVDSGLKYLAGDCGLLANRDWGP
jgi:hypothetical protein